MKDRIEFYKAAAVPDVTILDAHIASFKYDLHAHDDFAIGLTRQGLQCFSCSKKDYRVRPGGVIFINPEEPHDGFAVSEEGYSYKMIYVPRWIFNDLAMDSKDGFRFSDTVTYDRKVRRIVEDYLRELDAAKGCSMEAENALHQMVVGLAEVNGLEVQRNQSKAKRDLVDRAMGLMYSQVDQAVSLDEICSQLGVSKYHFIRTFKGETCRTPYQYLLDLRLEKARKALENGVPPRLVAETFAFYDASHFIKRFKKAYGITPAKYQDFF
jgi:AraC-like DNA-binding protein